MHPVCFSLVGPDRHKNLSIGNYLALWDLGVVDEEDGVCPFDTVPYTLRQPSNVIGEIRGPGAFISSVYTLFVPMGFSCGGYLPAGSEIGRASR